MANTLTSTRMDDYRYIGCPTSGREVEVNVTERTANGYGVSDGIVTDVDLATMTFICPCQHDGCQVIHTVELVTR